MKIFFASSEVAPFIKTGGLADVAGSLPPALAAKPGNDVRVILPLYSGISDTWRSQMTFVKYFYFHLGWRSCYCGLFQLERNNVTYYFVDNETYFKRNGLYGHFDDGERYAYFSKAVVEIPAQIGWSPDIIHCNDWQTALIPLYLREAKKGVPELSGTKTVYTIHNIEYQGRYGNSILSDVFGLDYNTYFNESMLSFYNDVNLMKGAIYASDFVTTVSPNYAKELSYAFYAHGLEGVIAENQHKIRGILNGIDVDGFNAEKDTKIPANFSSTDFAGKAKCKEELQKQLGLNVDPDVAIIGGISRLVSHKGFDLVVNAFDRIMEHNVQFVILGTGEYGFEEFFRNAQARYPGRVSANITYSAPLSSAIYAGADLFLMPSIAEPCGLSQMIAMRYGTVPIVRLTGGLKDSVPAYEPEEDTGLGFTFGNINAEDMLDAVDRALAAYADKDVWAGLMKRGMEADFSWNKSAEEYMDIYRSILE
ncbi:MAG: glycogen synthase GlgA [Oscillospiraceae bacterium]|nr:glycogen synthase GlgA [Oscillospiraceae bacterium]